MSAPSSIKDCEKANSETEEFRILRSYIQKCPDIPSKSRAVQTALAALDLELNRMERDAKLKRKFSSTPSDSAALRNGNSSTAIILQDECSSTALNTNSKDANATNSGIDNDDELMTEWEDVAQEPKSLLGARLAQLAVAAMAQHQVSVKSPLAAVSPVLHAALCTPVLGFVCTGVPETATVSKGFAPPIRELPKGQFLPSNWDDKSQQPSDGIIRLRYRKQSVGSIVLTVTTGQDLKREIHVNLTSANSTELPLHQLSFLMDDHINIESFHKVLKKEGSVHPALHYKDLPTLLTNFANTVDIGPIYDSAESIPDELPYVDRTAISAPSLKEPMSIPPRAFSECEIPTIDPYNMPGYNPYENPTIKIFHPPGSSRGDFAGDLQPPGIGDFMGHGGGNLMGPNHPMFGRDSLTGAGHGMRPRFDPFGPPGGPQDVTPNDLKVPSRTRPPPGGFGEPNPDHLRPPNNLTNNMFM